MSLSSSPIRLNKGIRQREKCDPEEELKEGNPKGGRVVKEKRSGSSFLTSMLVLATMSG